jgi:hypothetical protein
MRKTFAVVSVLLLVITGCRFSDIKSDETVHISGRALSASGAPLAGVQVRLFKEADLFEAVTGIVLAIGSLGSVCLLPDAPAVCRQAHVATTDADGKYSFTLTGADVQGTLGTEATLDVVMSGPGANAPSTAISFPARSATMHLPAVRLWRTTPHVVTGRDQVRMRWSPLPRSNGTDPAYFAQLFDQRRETPVWSQPAERTGGTIDARVLEGQSASAAATARAELDGATGTEDVRAVYLSSRVPLRAARAGVPPSRNDACFAVSGTSPPLKLTRQPTCGVTDGDLISAASLRANRGANVTGVVVDLGRPRPVDLIVARGLAGQYVIELSTDGKNYLTVSTSTESPTAVEPAGQPVARYVRVRSPSGLGESLMTEISVW